MEVVTFCAFFVTLVSAAASIPAPALIDPLKSVKAFGSANSKIPKCADTQTLFKGKCFAVLQPLPCLGKGEWLVEDDKGQGRCIKNPCANEWGTGWYNGKCIPIRSEQDCPAGMKSYIYKSGTVDCDCKDGFIFHEASGQCYESHKQGPCPVGEIFTISGGSSQPGCVINPCSSKKEGYVCNPGTKCETEMKSKGFWFWSWNWKGPWSWKMRSQENSCVLLGSVCDRIGDNDKGIIVIDPETMKPSCSAPGGDYIPTTRIIGNVPTLRCAPGSRRDILGNCRKPTIIEFS